MRRRLKDESGIALVVALGMVIVLAILVASMISYVTSNQRSAELSSSQIQAAHYAEGGLNGAVSILNQVNTNYINAAAPNLLGCAVGTASPGVSDCSSPTQRSFCFTVATGCTAGTNGTATVYGFFSGTNPQTYNSISVPASTWLLIANGYARNPGANIVTSASAMALVKISSPLNSTSAVASVWNHVFITAPLIPDTCSLSFAGNSVTVSAPLYIIGNLCLGSNGSGAVIKEVSQPVDLQVGGKLVLIGGSTIGADALTPITSGVIVGGCTTVSVSSSTTLCNPTNFNYWVRTPDTWIPNDAPAKSQAEMASDWATFDPGPKHPCQAGTSPAPPAGFVDGDAGSNLANEPNTSAGTFELTPSSSYSCISQSGAGTGQLSWNNSTKQLTINGKIFFDGNLTISQTASYTGTAVIDVAGTITFKGNNNTLCAESPCSTVASAWQGTSGNNSMLNLVSLAANTTAITFSNNAQVFQGSLWTQPSSGMTFVKNGVIVEGPMSIGSFDATFNNASLIPFPVINNMPLGAPVPPNAGATISSLTYVK